MDKSILDASVVIKWFVQEEGSKKADFYLERLSRHELTIVVPRLLFYEVGNILISKKVPEDQSSNIAQKLFSLPFEEKQIDPVFFRKSIQMAQTFDISFYDVAYITLMEEKHCEFITADKKLYEKVHKRFDGIRLL